ncbi:hypothetical protein [Apilactobacillus quenuiae]|uniref:hypothetical protein n=1 Tax=Apilactobacillus quenuiae TaxID=2008377 RepID=UPI000D01694F|nr:hypothetical protein [Apilactobacillus quenuiae]
MDNKLSINKYAAIFNIIAIILQIAARVMATTSHSISIGVAGIIIIIVALITIILNIIALVQDNKNNLSKSGAILGIIGGVFLFIFGLVGWILLIISTIQLFNQKTSNN